MVPEFDHAMSIGRLFYRVAVSGILAGPAGGLLFGLLNAGDPDPNPVGRLAYACLMAVMTPLHAGFPPQGPAGSAQVFNVWPHMTVAFVLILGWFVHRDRRISARQGRPAA